MGANQGILPRGAKQRSSQKKPDKRGTVPGEQWLQMASITS